MNAVTKTLTYRNFAARPLFVSLSLPVPRWQMVVAFCAVLITAFSLLYMKDLNRRLYNQYQNLQQTSTALSISNSKLLLEESALSAQARVQSVAQHFNMVVPTAAETKIITV